MKSLFCCPLCAAPLDREETRYTCPNGHCFDRAKEGYVHLLPANRLHSKAPGDDKSMAAARNRFLSGDYYDHLRNTLCRLATDYTGSTPAVLDSGCGEGYYTAGVFSALRAVGKTPLMAGVDLSKPSLRWAARRERTVEFAVATAYHLPIGNQSVDLLLNCFSPLALDEFRRVLRPGGVLLYVVPAAQHLWELKEVLYQKPYLNTEEETPYEGFSYLDIVKTEARAQLESQAVVMDLFRMTPYYWKTPKEGAVRLASLERLEITSAFRVHIFRRNG